MTTTEIRFVSVSSMHDGGTKFYRVSRVEGPNGVVVVTNWGPFKGTRLFPRDSAPSRMKRMTLLNPIGGKEEFERAIDEKTRREYNHWTTDETTIFNAPDRVSGIEHLRSWFGHNEATAIMNEIWHAEEVEEVQRFTPEATVSEANLADPEWGAW